MKVNRITLEKNQYFISHNGSEVFAHPHDEDDACPAGTVISTIHQIEIFDTYQEAVDRKDEIEG